MPTYVYRFLDRDGTIEVQQAFSEDALTEAVHPDDGLVHPVKKVFTPVGVSFKGNGFYKTDSRGSKSTSSSGSNGSRTVNTSATDSACRRRATNASTCADDRSSH